MHLRLLDDPPGAPAHNLALDEALLHAAAAPTLRLYGWRPAAVSLGRFQRRSDFADVPAATALVRRPTGGGAIHHDGELTFALAADARLLGGIDDAYALVHDAVATALAAAGVAVRRLADGPAAGARPRQRWCFALPGRHDLVAPDGRKLVGSAQRRTRSGGRARVLQHGSIALRRPALTPFAGAVADQADPLAVEARLRRDLPGLLALRLRLALRPDRATAAELALAARLRHERYGAPEFLAAR